MKRIKHFKKFNEDQEIFTNTKGGKFWGDQGAGVLPIAKSSGKILIALRSDQVNEPNTWGIFGGKVDDPKKDKRFTEKEEPKEAALRELKEEVGFKGQVELIPAHIYVSNDKKFEYHNFLGIVENEFKPKLDWETSEARWVTLDELIHIDKKHFGLKALLDNSMDLIKKYAQ